MSRRLANVKTREETGLKYVANNLVIGTSFGQQVLKDIKPYFPGDEFCLEKELNRVEALVNFIKKEKEICNKIEIDVFMCMEATTKTITRSKVSVLSVVELFEIKSLLLQMDKLKKFLTNVDCYIPEEYILDDVTELLDVLDPRGDRLDTFYLYEEFSDNLAKLRGEKRKLEIELRKEFKTIRMSLREKYGINLTPKYEISVPKNDKEVVGKISEIKELVVCDQDYMCITYSIKKSDKAYEIARKIEEYTELLEEEELVVTTKLTNIVASYVDLLVSNCEKIGQFDFALAKAKYAIEHSCIEPEIVDKHVIIIENGRHLQVEDVLKAKNKEYMPISVKLKEGVSCITGANMGGKTISLKLVGLVAMLAQYGFFVPCDSAKIGLSNYMQILIGDSQSVERGLSSFGSEMEILKEILDNGTDRSLILIDEIASGTNPVEGLALTRSLIDYLKVRPYISLITTHFDAVKDQGIVNYQVVGLANANFRQLDGAIKYAKRKERIEIIAREMDYRLREVTGEREIPKDALNIAKMLGIGDEIIDNAKRYLK